KFPSLNLRLFYNLKSVGLIALSGNFSTKAAAFFQLPNEYKKAPKPLPLRQSDESVRFLPVCLFPDFHQKIKALKVCLFVQKQIRYLLGREIYVPSRLKNQQVVAVGLYLFFPSPAQYQSEKKLYILYIKQLFSQY